MPSDVDDQFGDEEDQKICDRCGDPYDQYIVLVRDSFPDIVDAVNPEYENLCKPCRAHVFPNQAFTGAEDVDPKTEVEDARI